MDHTPTNQSVLDRLDALERTNRDDDALIAQVNLLIAQADARGKKNNLRLEALEKEDAARKGLEHEFEERIHALEQARSTVGYDRFGARPFGTPSPRPEMRLAEIDSEMAAHNKALGELRVEKERIRSQAERK